MATTSEWGLRSWAVSSVTPSYPVSAIRAHQTGIVVVAVELDTVNRVDKVEILESPCAAVSDATIKAVFQWKFNPPPRPPNTRARAKLTFYFLLYKGQYQVFNPKDAPRNIQRYLTHAGYSRIRAARGGG